MHNSGHGNQDQRTSSAMEDSAITIEFLRARLLAERSVSKSARQRANELAKRVEALEEQLHIVSLQRKKAEQATVDVLSILENNGISDICESFDSSSDQETPCGSKDSVSSSLGRNESGEFSGSEIDSSREPQRTLSWKGRKGAKHSPEKCKDSYRRRGSSFPSVSSSPKHRVGRSCRQIRRKESRSVVVEDKMEAVKDDSKENVVIALLEVSPIDSDGRPESLRRGSKPVEENAPLASCSDANCYGRESDKDMEKALEQQAQLIGKYEEMEKAQREWEERFKENNGSTPDSCDPGNQSDITEEREEVKAHALCPDDTNSFELAKSEKDRVKLNIELSKMEGVQFSHELSRNQVNGSIPPSQNVKQFLNGQKCCNVSASESQIQEFAFPTAKEKHNQKNLENGNCLHSKSPQNHLHPLDSDGNQLANFVASKTSSSCSTGDVSGRQNNLYALVPTEPAKELNSVLESLKQARLTLQQRMSSSSSMANASVIKSTESNTVHGFKIADRAELPVGFGGLFRLPTNFAVESGKTTFLDSGSQLSLEDYYPDPHSRLTSHNPILDLSNRSSYAANNFLVAPNSLSTMPYMNSWTSHSMNDQHLNSQYRETRSQYNAFSQRPTLEPNIEAAQPSFNGYTHPTSASYAELVPRVTFKEGFATFPNRSVGIPPTQNNLSFYNDLARPDMHR